MAYLPQAVRGKPSVDAMTFALDAGLGGVVVPLSNTINPKIRPEHIVDSFMVVVVGGVGKLAGAIIAGAGLGFVTKYLDASFQKVPFDASAALVVGKVVAWPTMGEALHGLPRIIRALDRGAARPDLRARGPRHLPGYMIAIAASIVVRVVALYLTKRLLKAAAATAGA